MGGYLCDTIGNTRLRRRRDSLCFHRGEGQTAPE